MFDLLKRWYLQRLSDPAAVTLILLLLAAFLLLWSLGNSLMPLLIALVLAYLCEGTVSWLERRHLPRALSATLFCGLVIGAVLLAVLVLLPLLWQQGVTLARETPTMLNQLQSRLMSLPAHYPELLRPEQVEQLFALFRDHLLAWGQLVLSASLGSLVSVMTVLVYAILVPLLLFFLLKDKQQLLQGVDRLLPANRHLADRVMAEMNQQVMNYVRGKLLEILLVGVASYLTFWLLGLNYAALLAVAVGLSVLIPYIGATVVTVPVVLVALLQWGVTPPFWYVISAYFVIQILDGNVLVPILFSEAVNLHPVAIIVAVLFFGGIWGFWGVFFAIPLATLVKAVINVWPTAASSETATSS